MTWDTSWKDITALDGLKRQPALAVHRNDLANAVKERYNDPPSDTRFILDTVDTRDYIYQTRKFGFIEWDFTKIALPPWGLHIDEFDPWEEVDNTNPFPKFFNPAMWSGGELTASYDPVGKTSVTWPTGTKEDWLTVSGYTEPPEKATRDTIDGKQLVYIKELLRRYLLNPVFFEIPIVSQLRFARRLQLELQYQYYNGVLYSSVTINDIFYPNLTCSQGFPEFNTYLQMAIADTISQPWDTPGGPPFSPGISLSMDYNEGNETGDGFYIETGYASLILPMTCHEDIIYGKTLLNGLELDLDHRARQWIKSVFSNEGAKRWWPNAVDGYNLLSERDKTTLEVTWPTPDRNAMDAIAGTLDLSLIPLTPYSGSYGEGSYYSGNSGSYSESWDTTDIISLVDNIAFEYV